MCSRTRVCTQDLPAQPHLLTCAHTWYWCCTPMSTHVACLLRGRMGPNRTGCCCFPVADWEPWVLCLGTGVPQVLAGVGV